MTPDLLAWFVAGLLCGLACGPIMWVLLDREAKREPERPVVSTEPTLLRADPFADAPLATEMYLRTNAPPGIYRVTVDGKTPIVERVESLYDAMAHGFLLNVDTLKVARVDLVADELPQGVEFAAHRFDGCRVVIDRALVTKGLIAATRQR